MGNLPSSTFTLLLTLFLADLVVVLPIACLRGLSRMDFSEGTGADRVGLGCLSSLACLFVGLAVTCIGVGLFYGFGPALDTVRSRPHVLPTVCIHAMLLFPALLTLRFELTGNVLIDNLGCGVLVTAVVYSVVCGLVAGALLHVSFTVLLVGGAAFVVLASLVQWLGGRNI